MYILDKTLFKKLLKERGFNTIGKLAEHLGIHRNSIHYYLAGNNVFPETFTKLLETLQVEPQDILVNTEERANNQFAEIAPVIDTLQTEFPQATFVLFGSRSRKRSHKYSDWDIGVYIKGGLKHETYRKMMRCVENAVDDLPFFVDLVNLNQADKYFLDEIAQDWKFLAGRLNGWVDLQRKAAA